MRRKKYKRNVEHVPRHFKLSPLGWFELLRQGLLGFWFFFFSFPRANKQRLEFSSECLEHMSNFAANF